MPSDLPHLFHHHLSDGFLLYDVAGTDPRFGETLVGLADEVPLILSRRVFPVEHLQRVAAFVAENLPLEYKIIGPAPGVFPAVDQSPYLVERLPVNDGLVGVLFCPPVQAVLPDALLGFIVDLPGVAPHHDPYSFCSISEMRALLHKSV